MFSRRLLLLSVLLLGAGCTFPVRQRTDQTVCRIANQPIDIKPDDTAAAKEPESVVQANATKPPASPMVKASGNRPGVQPANAGTPAGPKTAAAQAPANLPSATAKLPAAVPAQIGADPRSAQRIASKPAAQRAASSADANKNVLRYIDETAKGGDFDAKTAAWLGAPSAGTTIGDERTPASARGAPVQFAAWPSVDDGDLDRKKYELDIPRQIPASETPKVRELREEAMPSLPVEPRPLPGPDGRPYTLTDLQRMAAAYSPKLRQAAADVQRAYGVWQQSRTYANPTGTFFVDPNANNTSGGVNGLGIEQVVKTGGKQKLTAASAWKDYENAQLALRAARYDLATQVRQAYFALLVDRETLAVTRAVARFTDEIFRLQTAMVGAATVAAYEPTSLRAQAFTTRLAYQQAIVTYMYDWKSLVALLGLEQLPLTEVAGEIGRFIPYYDYDQVLGYVLRNHTDILTARNLVPQSRYNMKLAQVTPIPDLDVNYRYAKDFTAFPFGSYSQFLIGMSLPIWDRNKGNIIAAQASVARASEEQHNSARDLTNRLADAYTNYQNNLYAIEYYRRYILPDLVRYYRGVYARRPLDPDNINVGDLAFAQQNLSQNVTAYLQVLGNMWQSVVTVADFLQTDDLFQMATPRPLPELPDFGELSRWACGHSAIAASCGVVAGGGTNVGPAPPLPVPPPNAQRVGQAAMRARAPVHPATTQRRTSTSMATQRRQEER